jgi:hypothetical protein
MVLLFISRLLLFRLGATMQDKLLFFLLCVLRPMPGESKNRKNKSYLELAKI